MPQRITRTYLKSLVDSGRFAELREALEPVAQPIINPGRTMDILTALRGVFRFGARQESFYVLTLNGANKVIAAREISRGLVNRTLIHPREVFVDAITDRAVAVVLVHNHPSGSLGPSQDDRDVTKRLFDAGELLGIKVLDHLIVDNQASRYQSFCEFGIMPTGGA